MTLAYQRDRKLPMTVQGQSRLSMAGLQGVPGASADPPIPDAVAAAARRVALCQIRTSTRDLETIVRASVPHVS
jgi:hypothetical protein